MSPMVNRALRASALALLLTTGLAHAQRLSEDTRPDMTQRQQAVKTQETATKAAPFTTGLAQERTAQYEITRAIDFAQQSGDDAATSAQTTQSHRMVVEISVVSAADDGSGVIEGRVVKFDGRVENESGPVAVTFDFSNGAGDGTDALAEVLAGTRFRAEVNAQGNVTSIAGLDDLNAAIAASEYADTALFSPLDGEQLPRLLSKLFNAEGGVEFTADTDASNTWTTAESIDLEASGTLVITRGWTRGKGDDAFECAGVFSMALNPPAVANDGAAQGVIEAYAGTGRVLWLPDGGLEFLTSTENVSMRWTLGAMTVRSSQQSSTVIRNVTK